jgi:hypothetical protein
MNKSSRLPSEHLSSPSHRISPRHSRKCSVCRHRKCAEIEQAFLHWVNAVQIALDYGFDNPWPIYRHARAAGLSAMRREKVRRKLEPVIEQASLENFKPTGSSIIRAVNLCMLLSDDGPKIKSKPRTKRRSVLDAVLETVLHDPENKAPMRESEGASITSSELTNKSGV